MPTVRYLIQDTEPTSIRPPQPFSLRGAPNVFLETIKRGEQDEFSEKASGRTTTVVLRLYEAFGGHARATLNIADHVSVVKAITTNLLEDELDELRLTRAGEASSNSVFVHLDFHAFEVKTVKLEIKSVHSVDQER